MLVLQQFNIDLSFGTKFNCLCSLALMHVMGFMSCLNFVKQDQIYVGIMLVASKIQQNMLIQISQTEKPTYVFFGLVHTGKPHSLQFQIQGCLMMHVFCLSLMYFILSQQILLFMNAHSISQFYASNSVLLRYHRLEFHLQHASI